MMSTFRLDMFKHFLRQWGVSFALVSVVALVGCSAVVAQNPNQAYTPVNAVKEVGHSRLMLKGADVVAYFTKNQYIQGQSAFHSQWQGIDFYFSSAEHKALFDAKPEAYLPQYGGYCTNGIVYGIPWGGDADTWTMLDGKLYIFGGKASQDAFLLDPQTNLALAEKYWSEEVQGRNSFVQRAKRLIFKVPHYKTGAQLAQAVADSKS